MQQSHGGLDKAAGKITGPGSGALKYDILTALLVTAANGDPVTARLAVRLSLVITARFSWRRGAFSVGLRELARMWGVTERTAKRDMALMRSRCWITVRVPAARGRVAQYAIDLPAMLRDTMAHWDSVGPDFAARMAGAPEPGESSDNNVIPLRRAETSRPLPEDDGSVWSQAAVRLQSQDAALFEAWFAALRSVEQEGRRLVLSAPNRFQAEYVRTHFYNRLLAAIIACDPGITEIDIVSSQGNIAN